MNIVIVGHHSRVEWIEKLQRYFPRAKVVMDDEDRGAAWGHREALKIAARNRERTIIMEDDAAPVEGFEELAQSWFDRYPGDFLSFYLGTGRPKYWQRIVDTKLRTTQLDHIVLPQLLHAVCYSIPAFAVRRVLDQMTLPEADFALADAWGRLILYPVESLVEHRDGTPVEKHPDGEPRVERRVARKLAGPLIGDPR